MMLASDLVRLSLHNLLLHKIRSILTSLGVIFGVASVIAMLAVSEGAKREALSNLGAMGVDKIIVYSKAPPSEGERATGNRRGMVNRYGIESTDVDNIRKMDNIASVTGLRNSRLPVLRGLTRLDTKLVGVDIGFKDESNSTILSGRWLTEYDYINQASVCVIGSSAKRKLFQLRRDLLGETVKVGKYSFRIVGVLDNDLGAEYPEVGSPNDMIFIPINTLQGLLKSWSPDNTKIDYDLVIVTVRDIQYIDDTAKRIRAYLEKTHKKQDWGVSVPLDVLKQHEATQNIFTIVMASIASISLIVGGIGIMNIMLASVFERRKEIGTRRALGAQKGDILFQFLIETIFLTSIGGLIGIATGMAIGEVITFYAKMPTIYSSWSIIASLAISSFVGVVFGTYPAWKAAQQNPIEVLRAE